MTREAAMVNFSCVGRSKSRENGGVYGVLTKSLHFAKSPQPIRTVEFAPVAQLDRALASGANSRSPRSIIFNESRALSATLKDGVCIYDGDQNGDSCGVCA